MFLVVVMFLVPRVLARRLVMVVSLHARQVLDHIDQVMVQILVMTVSHHDHQVVDYMDQMTGQLN